MKRIFLICRYFLTWQVMLRWFSVLGLVFLVVSPVFLFLAKISSEAALTQNHLFNIASMLLFFACLLLIAFPFLATPLLFRNLISNQQLSLLPNFHLKVGLSILLLTILLSLIPILSVILVLVVPINSELLMFMSLSILNVFCAASFYTLLLQLTLPFRYFMYIAAYGFIVVVLILKFIGPIIGPLFVDPSYVLSFTLICMAGWVIGLCILAKKKSFKPADKSVTDQSYLANPENSFLNNFNFNKIKSAAGTILTGAPDSLATRLKTAFIVSIVSPLIVTLGMMFIGLGELSEVGEAPNLVEFYLIFSFFTVSIGSYAYSNYGPRARYLWLRAGGNRLWHWRHLETNLFTMIALHFGMLLPACMVILLFTDTNAFMIFNFIYSFIAFSLFITFLGLSSRIKNWSNIIMFILMLSFILAIVFIYYRLLAESQFFFKFLIDTALIL